MVCLGNICKSPLAEGILQHKADTHHLNILVNSAGTGNYHIGEAPHQLSQKVANLNGVNISGGTSPGYITDFVNGSPTNSGLPALLTHLKKPVIIVFLRASARKFG